MTDTDTHLDQLQVVEPVALPQTTDDFEDSPLGRYIDTYGPYLNDLWQRLYRTSVLFAVVAVLGFVCSQPILKYVLHIFKSNYVTIVSVSPFQLIDLALDIGFFFAFLVSVPYFVWQLCAFARQAVSRREFLFIMSLLLLSLLLFAAGFFFGVGIMYVGLEPFALLNISIGLQNYWDIEKFLSAVLTTSTVLGVLFQFPLVITLLIKVGVLDRTILVQYRRAAYIIIVLFVGLLPPPDVLSTIITAIPLFILYEIAVWLNREKA